jgi:hypothetical protein
MQDPRLKPLQAFWQELVVYLQQQLSGATGQGSAHPSGNTYQSGPHHHLAIAITYALTQFTTYMQHHHSSGI